jgi:hypothetical protein
MVFNEVTYVIGQHAVERLIERLPGTSPQHARNLLENMSKNGTVIIDVGKYRYIRYKDFLLVCALRQTKTYKIVSVITWDMLNGYSLQERIKKYCSW